MKRSPVIEMTALLDVILILMFLVLAGASRKAEDIEQVKINSEALEKRVEDLQNQNSSLSRRLNSFTVLQENCLVITLSETKIEDGSRSVLLECGETQNETVRLTWDNLQYVKNTLGSRLRNVITDALQGRYQAVFIVFQYDRGAIYQTDYRLISSVIQSEKTRDNVYCAEYDIREKRNE